MADHPHRPRLDATLILPRRTITRGSAPLATDRYRPGLLRTTPGAARPTTGDHATEWARRAKSPDAPERSRPTRFEYRHRMTNQGNLSRRAVLGRIDRMA